MFHDSTAKLGVTEAVGAETSEEVPTVACSLHATTHHIRHSDLKTERDELWAKFNLEVPSVTVTGDDMTLKFGPHTTVPKETAR